MEDPIKKVTSKDDYYSLIKGDLPNKQEGFVKALEYALDIRKFEIELYWKRATYFWGLIVVSFTGFFLLKSKSSGNENLIFLISCIGLVLSTGWYLVNRGSKYWQENWERHVDVLESKVIGSLYKTTIAKDEFPWWKLHCGYPYSVSKINQLISLYVIIIWVGLFFFTFPPLGSFFKSLPDFRTYAGWVFLVVTLCSLFSLLKWGRTGKEGKPRLINFRTSPVKSKDKDQEEPS